MMTEGAETSSAGRLIPLGQIVGTHGVRGLLRLRPYSDPSAALAATRTLYLIPRDTPARASLAEPARSTGAATPAAVAPRVLTLISARPHGRLVLLACADIETIDDAAALVGTDLAVAESDLPAAGPGEFYAYQLQGLEVRTVGGDRLGCVERVFATGSNDVLVVREGSREHLIPVIADVIRDIDVAGGRLLIEPLPGLLE